MFHIKGSIFHCLSIHTLTVKSWKTVSFKFYWYYKEVPLFSPKILISFCWEFICVWHFKWNFKQCYPCFVAKSQKHSLFHSLVFLSHKVIQKNFKCLTTVFSVSNKTKCCVIKKETCIFYARHLNIFICLKKDLKFLMNSLQHEYL